MFGISIVAGAFGMALGLAIDAARSGERSRRPTRGERAASAQGRADYFKAQRARQQEIEHAKWGEPFPNHPHEEHR